MNCKNVQDSMTTFVSYSDILLKRQIHQKVLTLMFRQVHDLGSLS